MPATQTPRPLNLGRSRRQFLKAAVQAGMGWLAQACTPANTAPPPIPWSAPAPTPTPTATATATPTRTPAPTATPTPPPAATPPPTATPAPDPEVVRPIGRNYPLPPDFHPSALHPLVSYPFIQVQPGKEAMLGHPEAAAWLSRLFAAARGEGISDLYVRSAYRSMAAQAHLWESAGGANQNRVAPPGTSEHQSGLAFDFATGLFDDSPLRFETTSAGRWLRVHAYRFGFVCTYPRPGIDGISAESWHYRYVGVQTSTQLYELNYLDPASTINPIEFYAGLLENRPP